MDKHLSEEEIDALEFKLLVEWLSAVPVAEWHVFAHNWNYDNADDILRWLIDNPRTERATALMLYWMLGARFYKQYATATEAGAQGAYVEASWRLIHELENKYLSNFYAAGQLGFDPGHDPFPEAKGYDWTADYQDVPSALPIPARLLEAVPGGQPPDTWTNSSVEGIPAFIWAQLEPHFGGD